MDIKIRKNSIRAYISIGNLFYVNAAGVQQVEELAEVIGKLENLRVLYLRHTLWGDRELIPLKKLPHLRVLNLSFSRVTDAGVKELEELKGLRGLYLYSSGVEDWEER